MAAVGARAMPVIKAWNFWLRNIDPVCFICEPAGSGPNHGGQHDNRSNNCDYSGGLRRGLRLKQ